MSRKQPKLFEGLRAKDLSGLVDHIFTIDQYKSKMGEDKDVVVLGFRVNDKYPATDLMEFIEKGYSYILDADMSTGEERDGKYQVFVELERTKKLPGQIKDMLEGISQLCDCWDWKFRYHKDIESMPVTAEALTEHVPMDATEYETKMMENKASSVAEFFNQGSADVALMDDITIVAQKVYAGPIEMELIDFGNYEAIKESIPGGIQLDEASRGQCIFLEKYLGAYEINKIDGKFLLRNGDKGMIVKKDRW
jgi:hypothetical protein